MKFRVATQVYDKTPKIRQIYLLSRFLTISEFFIILIPYNLVSLAANIKFEVNYLNELENIYKRGKYYAIKIIIQFLR